MSLASFAYFNDINVSLQSSEAGLIHTIITVLAFPSRESFKILVNLEYRKGMWELFFLFFFGAARELMTFASIVRLLLILIPSLTCFGFSDLHILSCPARSIKLNFDFITWSFRFVPSVFSLCICCWLRKRVNIT